jgi:Ca2+/Na+ antiporter
MNSKTRTYGILTGAGTVLYLLLFYFVDRSLFLNGGVTWSSLIIYLIFMFKAVREVRDAQGGELEFREALKPAFTVYFIANVIYYSFLYLMFNFFDPELVELQREMLEAGGIPTDGQNLEMSATVTFFAFLQSLIAGFAFSAAVAAILRR